VEVATANVLRSLDDRDASEALLGLLEHEPDLVGLQEWGLSRHRLLRRTGGVRTVVPGLATGLRTGRGPGGYTWVVPLAGGCAVGARVERFDLVACRTRLLGYVGRSDPGARPLPLAPPRVATVVVLRDRRPDGSDRPDRPHRPDRVVSVVCYHLTPGVQARGTYREDRPLLAARHQREVRDLDRLVTEEVRRGHTVYAVGDSNFDGLRLTGLTSAWHGREDGPGTLGPRRKIDDVHGPGPADAVTLLVNASDHTAVIASRADR
jgi:hypothetical protein